MAEWMRIARLSRTGKRKCCRLYEIWAAMKKRCYGAHRADFHHYGGRGIRVCDEWRTDYAPFRTWAIASGYRKELTLDRIDSNGNYEPSNCRWATRMEQTYNSSGTKIITFNGETLPSPIWAKRLGLHPVVFRSRITHGWTIEQAILTPKGSPRVGYIPKPRGRKHKSAFLPGCSANEGSNR